MNIAFLSPEETLTTLFYLEHELIMGAKSLAETKESDRINTYVNTKCVEITETGVWTENKEGKREFLECDNVIVATGYKIDEEAVRAFDNLSQDFITVGDCYKVANILNTSSTGYYASLQI